MDPRDEPSSPFADISLEAQLIGNLLVWPDAMAEIKLRPEAFFHPLHRPLFAAMQACAAEGKPPTNNRLFAMMGVKPGDEALMGEGVTWKRFVEVLFEEGGGYRARTDLKDDAHTLCLLAARRAMLEAAGYRNGGDVAAELDEVQARLRAIGEAVAMPSASRINACDADTFANLAPPDYLVEGLLQRGFVYGLTGQSGIGKTNVAIRIAVCISQGQAIGPHLVTDPGPVLYLIGENPDDWRYRLLGLKAYEGLAETGVHNVLGPSDLGAAFALAKAHIERCGPMRAIVVDTSVAHLPGGSDENDNPSMLSHAKALRHMTELPGRPAVIVICHPPKNGVTDASMLIPRGGSAFFAELDGNFTLWGSGSEPMEFHFNKLRGPMFAPLMFEHVSFFVPEVVDARGVQQSCIMARVMSKGAQAAFEARHSQDQEDMMVAILGGLDSGPAIATHCGWWASGEPDRKKAMRVASELKGYVEIARRRYILTKSRGLAEAERIKTEREARPHAYKD